MRPSFALVAVAALACSHDATSPAPPAVRVTQANARAAGTQIIHTPEGRAVRVQVLGAHPGLSQSIAYSISDHGVAVGSSTGRIDEENFERAFVWTASTGLVDATPPGSGRNSRLSRVNNVGDAVGSFGSPSRPILRRASGAFVDFAAEVDWRGAATGISASGIITGVASLPGFSRSQLAIWSDDVMRGIGYPEFTYNVGQVVSNDNNEVVGSSADPFVFYWNRWRGWYWSGATGFIDFGIASGEVQVFHLNNHGVAAGYTRAEGGVHRPYLWSRASGVQDLAPLFGGRAAIAYGVNDRGQISGQMLVDGNWHVYLWTTESGLIDMGPGGATGINNRGQIPGFLDGTATIWTLGPLVRPTITGTLGDNGWYVSDVQVSWLTSDPESSITRTTGCAAASVLSDGGALEVSCEATNALEVTDRQVVTIHRDATPPSVTFSGNAGVYDVDQLVSIDCTATDVTSGIASSTCQNIVGPAHGFAALNSFSATARDRAGNTASASASFAVRATYEGLCGVVRQFVNKGGVANSLCAKLSAAEAAARRGDLAAKAGSLNAFANEAAAQEGKVIDAGSVAILVRLAAAL